MKTLILLVILALCAFGYMQSHKPAPDPELGALPAPKAKPKVAAIPTPEKLYYHPAMDAPGVSTVFYSEGYYSTTPGPYNVADAQAYFAQKYPSPVGKAASHNLAVTTNGPAGMSSASRQPVPSPSGE